MARDVARAYGIKIYPTIAEALRVGGDKMAVDAVLSIGEHGRYPTNAKGQVEYPRKRFFDEIVAEFRRSGATAPVFNDKHLSYRADWAREMVETARGMGFGLMAASSVPLATRRPSLELPRARGSWKRSRCTAATWRATTSTGWRCCSRWSNREPAARRVSRKSSSSMETGCGRRPTKAGGRPNWPMPPGRPIPTPPGPARYERSSSRADSSEKIHGILVTYKDGLRGMVLNAARDGTHWHFACKIAGDPSPRATSFYVGPWDNRNLFKALAHAIQEFFRDPPGAVPDRADAPDDVCTRRGHGLPIPGAEARDDALPGRGLSAGRFPGHEGDGRDLEDSDAGYATTSWDRHDHASPAIGRIEALARWRPNSDQFTGRGR